MAEQTIEPARWGKDHWSTLAYVETCCVDRAGWLSGDRMRVHVRRHRTLVGRQQQMLGSALHTEYPTILRDGETLAKHDDWDCLEDICAAGLAEIVEELAGKNHGSVVGGTTVRVRLTLAGTEMAALLRAHKAEGKRFADFEPAVLV